MTSPEITEKENLMKTEALRIIDEARKRNLHVRLLGAIAFQRRCPKFTYLTRRLNRIISDVDFAAYSNESPRISAMMKELGYKDLPMLTAMYGHSRTIWDNASNGVHIDIFLDKLEMNHDVSFQGRLDVDPYTIPLEEMLLEKMQIVQLEEKDLVDTIMLLREHEVGLAGPETINAEYIAKLLSSDWGFNFTCTTNLKKVKNKVDSYEGLDQADRDDVKAKVDKLLKTIEARPKSFGWKARAKIGTTKKWYREVEEVRR